ncbi:MAG: nucleotidyltransferase family protein [Acidobacteria bacterium]|nr:nucleotidyltransferase family protein [Acidobacteriota bacterium]
MRTDESLKERRTDILAVTARHGARNVRIFGSVARGEDDPGSDIDFLVDLEPGRTLLDHAGLILDLQDLLGRKVDIATEGGLRPRIREQVLREARPL